MKLNPVPARTGLLWVKLGVQTFVRQPLAMGGLFLLFIGVLSVASMVPLFGTALALMLLPAASLGLMAAAQQASEGRFPMPLVLASAFRAGKDRMRAMWVLGVFYAVGFLAIMGLTALVDGGDFAKLYLTGQAVPVETLRSPAFQSAMWLAMALYLPLALLFWHAPALVHWHGVTPVKSLFFSWMACWRNKAALVVYGLGWLVLFVATSFTTGLLSTLLGGPQAFSWVVAPVALVLASMFLTSLYFTFRDSFVAGDSAADSTASSI